MLTYVFSPKSVTVIHADDASSDTDNGLAKPVKGGTITRDGDD